jgi:3-phenylpropionate/trans-cinnamate dioxygenase ferredoxin subunit
MERHVVARTDEIETGGHKTVRVKGREIALFRTQAGYFAILNRCPHEGAPLCHGYLGGLVESDRVGEFRVSRRGEMLRCPWHGWEFDLRTGQSWCDPTHVFVKTYNVAVEPGQDVVKGPYVAETFPVAVEGEYLVIEA